MARATLTPGAAAAPPRSPAALAATVARLPRRWPALGAALCASLLAALPLFFGKRYLGLDHSRVLLSMMCGARGDDGVVLDASFGGGGPLLEEPQGLVLYPLTLLLRALRVDVELAASLFVVAHIGLAAFAAARLARAKGMRAATTPIIAFGLAFAMCGTVLDLILHGPYLVGACGLALAWAGIVEVTSSIRRGRSGVGGAVMLAAAPALLLLSGELQAFGIALAVVLLELTVAFACRMPRRAAVTGAALAAFLSGALVGGVQLALSLGLASASSRAARVPDPFTWSLAPAQLLGVVWPGSLAERAADGSSLLTVVAGDAMARPPWNLSPFLGVPVIALACVAVVVSALRVRPRRSGRSAEPTARRRHRHNRHGRWKMIVPSLVAVFATLFALGDQTPVLRVALALVPPLAFFRYPAKYFVVASLALLLLAFHVVTVLARARANPALRSLPPSHGHRRSLRGALLAAVVVCSVGLLAAIAMHERVDTLAAALATRPPWPGEPTLGALLVGRAVLAFAFAALAALVAFRAPRLVPVALALPFVIVFVRDAPTGLPLTSLPARTAPASTQTGAVVCHGRLIGARHVDRAGEPPLGIEGDVIVDWLDLKPNMHQCQDVAVPHAAMASSQGPTFTLATAKIDETLVASTPAWALGCTHIATRAPLPSIAAALDVDRAIAPALGVDAPIFPLRVPAVDVAVARSPKLYANGDEAIDAIDAIDAPTPAAPTGARPEDVANVIDAPTAASPPRALPIASRDLVVDARWESTTRATVSFSSTATATATGGAVVALRRPWWPGFSATQNGVAVPVVRAAGVQLAIVVDDVTRGDVTIEYHVRNRNIAVASGAAGIVVFAALMLLLLLQQRATTTATSPGPP